VVVSGVATSRPTGSDRIKEDDDIVGLDGGWVVDVRFMATATPGCDGVGPAGVGLRACDGGSGVSDV